MKRILCELFGCWCDMNHACPKCGCALWDPDFIQRGKLAWVFEVRDFFRGIYSFSFHHCEICRKRMWFTRNEPCCSQKCYDQWIPF